MYKMRENRFNEEKNMYKMRENTFYMRGKTCIR